MKIKDIRASIHTTSIDVPFLADRVRGYGRAEQQEFVFCEVETNEGLTGVAITGHFLTRAVVAALQQHFLPVVQDMDVRDVEAIHWRVGRKLNPRAMTGVVSSALSLLDIALWDIHGQAVGRSVAGLLGGARTEVDSYVTFGLPQYDREQLAAAARLQVDNGFTVLKLIVAVNKGGWREDAARIRAVREEVGEGIDIMIDANYMFPPVQAMYLMTQLGLRWFEEPCDPLDYAPAERSDRKLAGPMATGENLFSHQDARNLIRFGGMRPDRDILQFDCALSYGLVEYLRTLDMLHRHGWSARRCIPHGGHQMSLNIAAGLKLGGNESYPDVFEPFNGFADDIAVEDSYVTLPEEPGIGMEAKSELYRTVLKPLVET